MKKLVTLLLAVAFIFFINADCLVSKEELSKYKVVFMETALSSPNEVIRLCLGGQGIGALPDAVMLCKNMRDINLAQNNLTTLPDWIGSLNNIEEINLSGNMLNSLPDSFFVLNLSVLDLSGNIELASSNVFNKLDKFLILEELSLAECGLKSLPEAIFKLKNLKTLDLSGNEFSESEKNEITNKLNRIKVYF